MKFEGPGHTLHIIGEGEDAWAKSLELFSLRILNEDLGKSEGDLREALRLTAEAFEGRLMIELEHHGRKGTYLGEAVYTWMTAMLRPQILLFQLGRMLSKSDPENAARCLEHAFLEDLPLGKTAVGSESDMKDPDSWTLAEEGFYLLKTTWNPEVLLLLTSAKQRTDVEAARQMEPQLARLLRHDQWNDFVAAEGVWGAFGLLQRVQGEGDAARISLHWAVEDNPQSYASMVGLAKSYLELGDCEAALEWARRAEEGMTVASLQAFLLRMDTLRRLGHYDQVVESIDGGRYWPNEWSDFEPDWKDKETAVAIRLDLARLRGFCEAAGGSPSSVELAGAISMVEAEPLIDVERDFVLSEFGRPVLSQLAEMEERIAQRLRITLGQAWRSLPAPSRQDLIQAERLYETHGGTPDFSWRGAAAHYFAPVEALKRRIVRGLRRLLPESATHERLNVGGDRERPVRWLASSNFRDLMFVLSDATSDRPQNPLLREVPRTTRLSLRSVLNERDQKRVMRAEQLRNTIHEEDVSEDALTEMRELVLNPESSVLIFLLAIERALQG